MIILYAMRKTKREMPADWALEVFDKAPFITVSMTKPDGTPYAVPLSLVRTDDHTFYFHCAMEGDKTDFLAQHPEVCLSAVSKCAPTVGPKDDSFTLQFRSAIAFGLATEVTDLEEKVEAMRAICTRFLPKHMDAFDAAITRSIARTKVMKITLTSVPTGKHKEYDAEGNEIIHPMMR